MPSFRQKSGICLLNALLDHCRLNRSMVDEKKHLRPFCAVVRITDPTVTLEAPAVIFDAQGDQLVGGGTSMNLSNTVFRTSSSRHCHTASSIVAHLPTRERDTLAVNSITSNEVEDFRILFAGRTK